MTSCINIKLENLVDLIDIEYDIFICSSSFEERCLSIPKVLSNVKFGKVLICHYENNYEMADANFHMLSNILHSSTVVDFYKDSPIGNLDNIVNELTRYRKSIRKKTISILVDISTFTHEMILILTVLFKKYFTRSEYIVKTVYNSAIDYSYKESADEKWLSKGVGEIRTVLGYPGEILPTKKNLLIILVGFEPDRIKSIVEIFEPTKVLLGHASEAGAINSTLLKKNWSVFDNIKRTINIPVDDFEFSCTTPSETESVLQDLIKKYTNEYNIIISGLNNKISTIGCALAAIENNQVQLCYAPALIYNIDSYSKPSDNAYLIEY